jgi:hypothetical protein
VAMSFCTQPQMSHSMTSSPFCGSEVSHSVQHTFEERDFEEKVMEMDPLMSCGLQCLMWWRLTSSQQNPAQNPVCTCVIEVILATLPNVYRALIASQSLLQALHKHSLSQSLQLDGAGTVFTSSDKGRNQNPEQLSNYCKVAQLAS